MKTTPRADHGRSVPPRLRITRSALLATLLSGVALALAPAEESGAPTPPPSIGSSTFPDPLPISGLFSAEKIKSEFDRLTITPFDDPRLRFEILAPKSWESRPIAISAEDRAAEDEQFVPLAEIAPKGVDNVLIEIRYIRLPAEVTLKQIADHYSREGGFTVIAQQQGEYNDRMAFDSLMTVDTQEFGVMAARFTLSRHGELVYLVACSAPASSYDTYRNTFGAAAVTFAPTAIN